jgi:spore maturation protein CgeB
MADQNPLRLAVSPRMREHMSYDKFAGGAPRILVLEGQYWLDAACINAARQMGWEVRAVPVAFEGVLPRDSVAALLETLVTFRPDFVLTVNLGAMDENGLFARLFEDLHIPYVTWFVDNPRTIIMGRTLYASSYSVAATWDEAYIPYLRSAGFPTVEWLPLAADTSVFNAEPLETCDLPPTFVGNSMFEPAQDHWRLIRKRPDIAEAIERAFSEGRVTRDNFRQGIETMLPPEILARMDEHERRLAEMVFFMEGTHRLRRDLIGRLAPEGIHVAGDEAWAHLYPNNTGPAGDKGLQPLAFEGPINYRQALPSLYQRCEINLNSTSIQMPTAVNQRVFDCPAAGGFLLTDDQPALRNLFDVETDVACYHSLDDCVQSLRWYRERPRVRREIARRARERILAEHTYTHRLTKLLAILRDRFAG